MTLEFFYNTLSSHSQEMNDLKVLSPTPKKSELLIITALKSALRNPHRVNVYIDNKYSFSLSLAELSDLGLRKNQRLTEKQLLEYQSLSSIGKLYNQTLEYCMNRPHSRKEIEDFLRRKKYRRELIWERYEHSLSVQEEDEGSTASTAEKRKNHLKVQKPANRINDYMIERVLLRLEQHGVINDIEFTRFYIANRRQSKGISRKRLILELKQKGIKDQLIQDSLSSDEYGDTPRDEAIEIRKMIKKKAKQTTDQTKIITYLLRQGFPYDLIKTEMNAFFTNHHHS